MQVKNTHPPIRLTGRQVTITEAREDYVCHRIAALHLDYPTILEVHVLVHLEKYRRRADIILGCNRHLVQFVRRRVPGALWDPTSPVTAPSFSTRFVGLCRTG